MPEQATRAPAATTMLDEIVEGLSQSQKQLSPKFFYDDRGCRLFDRITTLPEYYPTRAERALLSSFAADWLRRLRPRSLVELGAGSADKTGILLDALTACADKSRYVPVDISGGYLESIVTRLAVEYPDLEVVPVEADITESLDLPPDTPRPVVFAFLGSTIGNFEEADAVDLLARKREAMRAGDRFLLGVDLDKDVTRLEAAYNDAQGVTAEFNLNILHVLNRELGADFDPAAFRHVARYDQDRHRIEMHLVARAPQTVHIPGAPEVKLSRGESIRTEISCKYDRATVEKLLGQAGLALDRWVPDEANDYALAVGRLEDER